MNKKLEKLLPFVSGPARYLGLERNQVIKDHEQVELRMALVYPDLYEIGMSHYGSRIVYNLVNALDWCLAERAYAPWPDMAGAMKQSGSTLCTLESGTPLKAFDIVGITLQTELNYSNIPYLLKLAEIPPLAEHRTEDHPIIIAGGPCMANPEPIAPFFDLMYVGEAEAGLRELLEHLRRAKKAGLSKEETIATAARELNGIYAPRYYHFHKDGWRSEPGFPLPVKRIWPEKLSPELQEPLPIIPCADTIQDRLVVEVMRGCTRGCRFCQAGYWYRPVRELPANIAAKIALSHAKATGLDEVSLMSLSTSDYSRIEELASHLADALEPYKVSISLPSLRADSFSVHLATAVARVRKSTFTFAPEAGSERLRRVINKSLAEQDLLDAVQAAFSAGWKAVKLYAMVGLPTETDKDVEELARMVLETARVASKTRGARAKVRLSVGCFVPKAWTPFQWEPFAGQELLHHRIKILLENLKHNKKVEVKWDRPELAAVEALLARGDRSLSQLILEAEARGCRFDGWSDMAKPDLWFRTAEDLGIDTGSILGPRNRKDPLPWDVVDPGVSRDFLLREATRSRKAAVTQDCKWGACIRCGIPGNGKDIVLSPPLSLEAAKPQKKKPSPPSSRTRRWRMTYSKTGTARFLSHRQTMRALERALRAAHLPLKYTEGFNPRVKLSFGPALPVGFEALSEPFDVELEGPLPSGALEAINRNLPKGLEVLSARQLLPGAPTIGSMVAGARYRVWIPRKLPALQEIGNVSQIKGLRSVVEFPDNSVRIELAANAPALRTLLQELGLSHEEALSCRVVREMLLLEPKKS